MCQRSLKEATAADGPGSNALGREPDIQAVLQELDRQCAAGFTVHPKMETLKNILVQHFGQNIQDPADDIDSAENTPASSTRAMVFVTNREAIDEIVEFLSLESPLIRPTKFIGQGADKQGNKGMLQREQLDVNTIFPVGALSHPIVGYPEI